MGWCARLWLAGWLVVGVGARAQGPVDGAIRGRVWAVCGPYPHRCVAREVRVWLRSVDRGVERVVAADSEGNFLVMRLAPGEYEVRAVAHTLGVQGLGGVAEARVDLEGGDLEDVTLTLGPAHSGALAGGAGLRLTAFELAGPDAGTDAGLPVEAGRWENLAELDSEANEAPASTQTEESASDDADDPASRVSAGDGAASTGLSYAGLPSTQGGFSLDGLSGEQSFRAGPRGSASGGASSGASYNQGSVRSFRVLPRSFSAQYGMVGGLAVVSRGASAGLHGNVFVRERESGWAATNPFSIATRYADGVVTSEAVKPAGSLLQVGGSVGVPLWGKGEGEEAAGVEI